MTTSFLEQLPSDAFIRILQRFLHIISLVMIVIISAYFIIKKVKERIGDVGYEDYR